ncbi:MAG: hypothetical protein N4A65_09185 [Cohaesibacter sp.]|jgi:hypothetical protein|nr:hypothetical protein [Cohaesibacter sp.]
MNRWLILLFVFIFSPTFANASSCLHTASNWQQQAIENLTYRGAPVSQAVLSSARFLRCIKMNNYVCMMHPSANSRWNGTNGRHDCALSQRNGHAVFSAGKWSIRAMVRDLCSKYRGRNRDPARSALSIVEVRTPWCDTLGSAASRGGYARTCPKGPRPSRSQMANMRKCQKPVNGNPTSRQCQNCNCPNKVADRLVRGLGRHGIRTSSSDLKLFADQGALNKPVLSLLISNIVHDETGGFRPTQKLLDEAFAISGRCLP